jgi:hypothetical protein
MHPFFTTELVHAHRDELVQQANASRLAAHACSSRLLTKKSCSRRLREREPWKGANNVHRPAYQ